MIGLVMLHHLGWTYGFPEQNGSSRNEEKESICWEAKDGIGTGTFGFNITKTILYLSFF